MLAGDVFPQDLGFILRFFQGEQPPGDVQEYPPARIDRRRAAEGSGLVFRRRLLGKRPERTVPGGSAGPGRRSGRLRSRRLGFLGRRRAPGLRRGAARRRPPAGRRGDVPRGAAGGAGAFRFLRRPTFSSGGPLGFGWPRRLAFGWRGGRRGAGRGGFAGACSRGGAAAGFRRRHRRRHASPGAGRAAGVGRLTPCAGGCGCRTRPSGSVRRSRLAGRQRRRRGGWVEGGCGGGCGGRGHGRRLGRRHAIPPGGCAYTPPWRSRGHAGLIRPHARLPYRHAGLRDGTPGWAGQGAAGCCGTPGCSRPTNRRLRLLRHCRLRRSSRPVVAAAEHWLRGPSARLLRLGDARLRRPAGRLLRHAPAEAASRPVVAASAAAAASRAVAAAACRVGRGMAGCAGHPPAGCAGGIPCGGSAAACRAGQASRPAAPAGHSRPAGTARSLDARIADNYRAGSAAGSGSRSYCTGRYSCSFAATSRQRLPWCKPCRCREARSSRAPG